MAQVTDSELKAAADLQQYLKNRDEIDFFSGEPLRALRTLAYFDNVDFQLCASLAFAEITERDVREADRDSLEPILFLLESPDIEVQHSACAALGNLAVDAKNGVSIVLLGGLAPLIRLMNSPNVEVQCNAIGCITNLAMHEDNKAKIAQSEAVGLLTRHAKSKDIRVQKNATGALLSMTYSEDNRRQLVNAGAIPVLVELLSSPDIDVQFYCTTALSNIAVDAVGRSKLTQNEDRLVQSLVHLMDSTSPKIQCQAALAFRNLAAEENYQLEIVPAGGLPPLLRLLQSSSLPLLCSAVACIRNISIHPLNEFPIIDAGFLKPLVDLLGSTDNEEIQCHAISTLRNLAEDSDIKKLVFEAGVLEKCKLLGLEAPLSVQLEMAPLILKLALSDKLKSHLLSSGVFDVVIPLSNSESTDVQAGCALVLRELSSKVDDYSIFIQHWEQPNGGIHGYLRRFLANEDPSIQYFAIGSLLPLLESEDKRLISLIGKAEDIVQMIMTIAENDESDREFAALARRSLELLGPRLEEPPVEDFSSIGSFTSEKNLEPDEVLTRRLLKILAAKESFSIKHLELDEDEEDKVAAFARRFLRGARKFVSDDESEDEESEDEVATAVALAQRLLEKLDAEESKSDDESESGVGLAVTFARWLLEMVAAEESKSDDKSEEDEERKTVALARRLLEMVVAEEYFSSEPFTVADDKGIYGDCLQEFAGPRLTFAAIAQEILFEMVEDNWFYYVDHDLIRQFLQDPSVSAILPRLPSSSRLCRRCKNIRKLSIDFKIRHNVSKLTPETCEFCNILCAVLKSSSTGNEESIYVYRDGPSLKVSYSDHDPLDGRRVGFMLRICAKPGSTYAPEDISSGFPILPEMGSQLYFQLLRYWVTVCNTSHHCVPQSDSPLPTRVLDVGHGKLRLSYPYQKEGKYIALSHCWGDLKGSEKEKFCTYACNVRKKCIGIDYGSLPTSFQDAITTTRELGIQFLWIDSMCIIQRHEGCSKECDTFEDFETECKRMESYFGSAYCTIAATSAQDSNQGFLRPRSAGKCVTVPNASGPLYVCEAIDDFRRDVVEGALNQRGWVYQERALSRRTIHFTKTQTYWECGRGICCETLTKMHNDRASIFADANFPKSFLGNHETFRFLIVRIVFEEFSKLALSVSADRSRAILGLEERIAKALNTGAENGVFGCYLHRSLLWQRSGNTRMKRIGHPEAPKEPSWSWVAYEGEISYMVIPSGQVAWSNAVRSNIPNKLHDGASHLQQPDNASSTALEALARPFSLDEEAKQLLIFDKDDEPDIRNLRCIVMGRDEWIGRTDIGAHHGAKAEQGYYVLVVKPLSSKRDVYERVGVGRVQKRHILYNTRAVWVRIV